MLFISLNLFLACNSNEDIAPITTASKEHPVEANTKLSINQENPRTTALTPSPLETRLAAERAGVSTSLSSLIPTRDFDFSIEDLNHIAMRTGILLADTVLAIEELPKEKLLYNLAAIETGLTKMKAGKGLLSTLRDLNVQVTNDSLTRRELLTEMESIVSMSMPEQGFGKEDRTGPLLQAGAWLSSINLLCKAIDKDQNLAAANNLLRHGKVADYFLLYAKEAGQKKAPLIIIQQLSKALLSLKNISMKENIGPQDIQEIIAETNALLQLV